MSPFSTVGLAHERAGIAHREGNLDARGAGGR
jgi:hypothetical protein